MTYYTESHYYAGTGNNNSADPYGRRRYHDSPSSPRATPLTRQPSDASSSYAQSQPRSPSSPLSPSMYRNMSFPAGNDYTRSYSYGYPSPASSSQHSTDDYAAVLDWGHYDRVNTRDGAYWCLRPEYARTGEPSVVPEEEHSASSSQYSADDDLAETNWKHYTYHPTDEGGFWRLRPKYAHTGEPRVLPHQKPSRCATDDDDGGREPVAAYVCFWPGCEAKPFRRQADLQRHYTQRHLNETSRESFPCDHSKCSRSENAFGRLDHYRDHLRDYHKEDVCKRGSPVDAAWLESRTVSRRWWRCSKCVIRVDVAKHPDHVCPKCKTGCEEKRKRLRGMR